MCTEPTRTDDIQEHLGPCVPDHHAGAVQFLEQHARIIKLPGGGWRVWLRSAGIRVYGTTRWRALDEAANRVRGRPISALLQPESTHDFTCSQCAVSRRTKS